MFSKYCLYLSNICCGFGIGTQIIRIIHIHNSFKVMIVPILFLGLFITIAIVNIKTLKKRSKEKENDNENS